MTGSMQFQHCTRLRASDTLFRTLFVNKNQHVTTHPKSTCPRNKKILSMNTMQFTKQYFCKDYIHSDTIRNMTAQAAGL